ncbi:PREDICTED: uncharacterized protein LOC106787934 [Polistes canadensis]|uniref:uncharacterized protein LOC106787934 n=1 Tax=Polistes canadensis TaxID=91411 RepID=UPI000718B6E5|nr:PREDICTED: uncharacterized protein LOC106787934 [Polistes canadensis]
MEDPLNTTIDSSNKNTLEDEDLFIGYKNWDRLVAAASTIGYKEGIEDGQESVFQEGFDMGYRDAFNNAFKLGKYKSLTSSIEENIQLPSVVKTILSETKKGMCYICNEESLSKNVDRQIEDDLFVDIVEKQKTHSKDVIEILHQNLESVLIKNNIDIHGSVLDT